MSRPVHSLKGMVGSGNRLGRSIGFPTANLAKGTILPDGIERGVYAVWVKTGEMWYKGMANLGERPTLGLTELVIEAHLLDFSGNLYEKEIEIVFEEKIREERKFASLEELKTQLMSDRDRVIKLLAGRSDPDTHPK